MNGVSRRVCTGKYLCNAFTFQNGMKQGDDLFPLCFNFALE